MCHDQLMVVLELEKSTHTAHTNPTTTNCSTLAQFESWIKKKSSWQLMGPAVGHVSSDDQQWPEIGCSLLTVFAHWAKCVRVLSDSHCWSCHYACERVTQWTESSLSPYVKCCEFLLHADELRFSPLNMTYKYLAIYRYICSSHAGASFILMLHFPPTVHTHVGQVS